ncbi:hypothetical protein [Chitinophaga filiformis]|uniref:Uncharacterized protein n=1 Tax=Chitinophaga filiformis TaxID=104663 RepID=A0A1G7MGR2_CHIFI|nr:hypothetical protein [Chitinophaga filiformis]SDF61038.1 hypothetical protein SAMN04488121_102426 [Chitinophaga filiformis]
MPVNFFNDTLHTHSSNEQFGLCDKPHPIREPSYINEDRTEPWIGIVNNPNNHHVDFYGLDHALKIPIPEPNPDGKYLEKLCDGMMNHNNKLDFVELKEAQGGGKWIGNATKQILSAIRLYEENHNDIANYQEVNAYICNSLQPALNTNTMHPKQDFQNLSLTYGFKGELIVKQEIDI